MKEIFLLAAVVLGAAGPDASPTPSEVFEKRILPIFKSPNPSSCTQCHLAGVDLKNYILPSHEKTFLSLRDQGMVNLEKPEDSKILRLIERGEKEGASLIQAKVRQQEYEAFSEWIRASCADPKLRDAPKLPAAELAQPRRPVEVIRHARSDQVLESFVRSVWAQRFRCTGCHSPEGGQNAKLVQENGEEMNWVKESPRATLEHLVSRRIVNVKAPERSLLLLKPTNQVKHGGGQKMLVGDMAYKAFRAFAEEYARTVDDKYAKAAELPKPASPLVTFGSDHWLKIQNTPPAWDGRLLQATVFAWDAERKSWEAEPIAMNDRGVFGKGKLWQHDLVLMAAPGSARAEGWKRGKPALPAGRYLIRIHVDFQGRLEKDWKAVLGKSEFVGEKELDSSWPQGYGSMTVIEAGQLKR